MMVTTHTLVVRAHLSLLVTEAPAIHKFCCVCLLLITGLIWRSAAKGHECQQTILRSDVHPQEFRGRYVDCKKKT